MTTLDERIAALEALDEARITKGDFGKPTLCQCGHKSCRDYHLHSTGKFVQGSGFEKADAEFIAAAPEMMSVIRALKAERDVEHDLLWKLAHALDGAFISSWQSTSGWAKELEAAMSYLQRDGQP